MLLSWVYAHRGKLVEILDDWSRHTHLSRYFVIRLFKQPSQRDDLQRDMKRWLRDGLVVEDCGFDLIIFLAERIDAGQFGDVSALRHAFPSTNTEKAFGLSKAALRYCANYGVF